MKTSISASLTALWLSQQALAQIRVPPEFKVGAKWQIEISTSLDHTKPLTPSVPIWDVDLYHLARTPEIIPYLRVSISSPTHLPTPHHIMTQRLT